MYVCTYVRMYVCMYVCMYACIYVCTYIHMYVCMYVYQYKIYIMYIADGIETSHLIIITIQFVKMKKH